MIPTVIRALSISVLGALAFGFPASPLQAQDGWLGARSERYTMAGSADARDLQLTAARLEGFRTAVLRMFQGARYRSLPPTTVLVLDDERELRGLGLGDDLDGFFFPSESDNFILLTPETRRNQPFVPIFHHYFHAIAAENLPNAPLWLVEGLAEYYSTFEWSEDRTQILIGRPINSHIRLVRDEDDRLSLEELFAVRRDSDLYDEDDRNRIFYAQSWALVHFLMTREQGQGERDTGRFVQLMASGSSFEEAVDDAFRVNFRSLLAEFENHLDQRGTYPYLTMPLAGGTGGSATVGQEGLSRPRVQTYLGDVLVRAGRTDAAEAYFQRAIAEDENLADAYDSLGALRLQQERFAEAREYLERAVRSVEATHLSHLYYAQSFLRENPNLSGDLLSKARVELREAIRLGPSFPEAYHELALTYLDRREELQEAIQLLDAALNLRPGNQDYLITLSRVLIAQGTYDSARTVLLPLLDVTRDPAVRQEAESILASIAGRREGRGLTGEGFNEITSTPVEATTMAPSIETSPPAAAPGPVGIADDRVQLSRIISGEQLRGWLSLIDCRDGLTLTILTEDDSFSFHTRAPDRVEFATSTDAVGTELSCGPVDPPMPVVVTYREAPEGSEFLGVPIKIEFVDGPLGKSGQWPVDRK